MTEAPRGPAVCPSSLPESGMLILLVDWKPFVHPRGVYRLEDPGHWDQFQKDEARSCGFGPHDRDDVGRCPNAYAPPPEAEKLPAIRLGYQELADESLCLQCQGLRRPPWRGRLPIHHDDRRRAMGTGSAIDPRGGDGNPVPALLALSDGGFPPARRRPGDRGSDARRTGVEPTPPSRPAPTLSVVRSGTRSAPASRTGTPWSSTPTGADFGSGSSVNCGRTIEARVIPSRPGLFS